MCSLKRAFCTYVYCCISFGVPVLVSPDKSLSSSSSVHIFDPNATRNCRLETIRVPLETWDARALNEKRIIKFASRELEIQGLKTFNFLIIYYLHSTKVRTVRKWTGSTKSKRSVAFYVLWYTRSVPAHWPLPWICLRRSSERRGTTFYTRRFYTLFYSMCVVDRFPKRSKSCYVRFSLLETVEIFLHWSHTVPVFKQIIKNTWPYFADSQDTVFQRFWVRCL